MSKVITIHRLFVRAAGNHCDIADNVAGSPAYKSLRPLVITVDGGGSPVNLFYEVDAKDKKGILIPSDNTAAIFTAEHLATGGPGGSVEWQVVTQQEPINEQDV